MFIRSSSTSKRNAICICDTCEIEFDKKFKSIAALMKCENQLTFCSRECTTLARKKGGKLQIQISQNRDQTAWQQSLKKTMLEKHGVENPGQMDDHYDKCRKTLQHNFNVDCVMNIPHIQANLIEAAHTDEANAKRIATNIERYGHENVFGGKIIQARIANTLQIRYGVQHSSNIPGIGFKRQQTMKENGTVSKFAQNEFQAQFTKNVNWISWRTKTARENGTYQIAAAKRHETMKKNGYYTLHISKEEDRFYQQLCLLFKISDIKRQITVNNWCIDFFIASINTYIQYDGVYWHGLDRPIEIITAFKSPHDRVIHRTMMVDEMQNSWFKNNMLRLIRHRSDEKFDDLKSKLFSLS